MNNEAAMYELVSELARVKSRQDTLAALDIYHPDIELIAPGSDSQARGRIEVGRQLELFFKIFPDYRACLKQYAFNETVMLSSAQVSLTPNMPGKRCPRIELPVFFEFEFRDNKISKEVFNLDIGMLCRKAGILPAEFVGQISKLQSKMTRAETSAKAEPLSDLRTGL